MTHVFKTLICKAEPGDDGTITAIASTPDVDRYGDVVAPSWDLTSYRANAVIMDGHNYEGPVVGKAIEIDLVGDTLMMRVKFDESETNPVGRRLANQYREGFMHAFSVGFSPGTATPRSALPTDHPAYQEKGAGQFFENNALLEVSAVAIPANPHALAVRAKRWSIPAAAVPELLAAPSAAPDVETLRTIVRDELLALMGTTTDTEVQDVVDDFWADNDSQSADEPDGLDALLNLGK